MGEDDPVDSYDNIKTRNTLCAMFRNDAETMKYYDFICPSPGIKGKYITVSSSKLRNVEAKKDILSAAEVEIFGNISIFMQFISIHI